MATAILFLCNEVGQTAWCRRTVWPFTTTGRAELPHSTAAVIAARKNHAPHLIPVRKSPIGLALQPHALTISLSIIVPFVA